MPLRQTTLNTLLIGFVLTGSLFSASPQEAADAASMRADKAAFEGVCGSCHAIDIADGLRAESEWRETVDLMRSIGAKGTDEQFQRLLRYLIRTQTKVNVNTAPAPEIAPVLDIPLAAAESIVKWRAQKGNFKTLDDLKKVPGLDPAKLEARKDRIAFV